MSEHNEAIEAAALLRTIQQECWTLRCVSIPTGGDDADVGWEVVEHHMAKPHERVVAIGCTPTEALRCAASELKRPDDHIPDVGKMVGPAAIDELAALRAKATKGPWSVKICAYPGVIVNVEGEQIAGCFSDGIPWRVRDANAAFIVALVNAYDSGKLTAAPDVPEPVYKAVERILDEKSAWIARNDEVTKAVALAATIAAHTLIAKSCSICGGDDTAAPGDGWRPITSRRDIQSWEVSVAVNGDNVLTIGHNHLAGVEMTPELETAIEMAAHHLLSFLGVSALPAPPANPEAQK